MWLFMRTPGLYGKNPCHLPRTWNIWSMLVGPSDEERNTYLNQSGSSKNINRSKKETEKETESI